MIEMQERSLMKVNFLNPKDFDDMLVSERYIIHRDDSHSAQKKLWQDDQFELISSLDENLESIYGDKVFVSSEVRPFKAIHVDMYEKELNSEFIEIILEFLNKMDSEYSVLCSVSIITEDLMDIQLGQFIVGVDKVTVEETIKSLWSIKVGE